MKFLVDAQLPRRLAHWLTDARFDAIHTLDLPDANKTNDTQISAIADQDGRAVITKDDDFMYAHLGGASGARAAQGSGLAKQHFVRFPPCAPPG